MMQSWSVSSKVGLGVAFCTVFTAVVLLAGRDTAARPASPDRPRSDTTLPAQPVAPSTPPAVASLPEGPSPPESPSMDDNATVADLSRLVMPADETTAEENEQRGDALRQLGASSNPRAVPGLAYALRNDVDIRNRILAIDGLRRAALAGNPDRGIEDALVEASRSGEDVIASQAGQALAEIERHRR